MSESTYMIVRKYFDEEHPDHDKIIKTGLTRKEAQEHCSDDATQGEDANGNIIWFDCFHKE